MRQTVSLRRRLANLFASAKVRPDEKKRRWANLFPRSFPLSTRRSSSIVSGLVGLFQELRGEKNGRRPATATVASAFASPRIEPLEQRQLLATLLVNPDPGAGGFLTIGDAIDAAVPDDVIEVTAGDYSTENVNTDQIDITLRLLGDVTIGSLTGDMGTVDLDTFDLTTGGSGLTKRFDGVFVGSGDIVKIGGGTFILGGESDQYTGDIIINQGKISALTATSLGTSDGITEIKDGGGLKLGAQGFFDEPCYENIVAMGTGGGTGALQAANDVVLAGNLTLTGQTRINVYGNQEVFTISGDIDGSGGIYLFSGNSSNTLVLSGDNTYSGETVVRRGSLFAQGGNAIPDQSGVTVSPYMQISLTDSDETIGSLAGSGGTVELNSFTLTTGGAGVANVTTAFSGSIVGSGGVVKEGPGKWKLNSTNLFSGAAEVNGGELIVAGSLDPGIPDLPGDLANSNNVVRVNNGRLSGSGDLGGRTVILGPGGEISTAGGLQIGGVSFDPDTQFVVNIRGLTDYDKLVAGGDVDIRTADLVINVVDYMPNAGDSFTIIELPDPNDDAIPPFEDYWEGYAFVRDGVIFHISYVGGDGNDVVITVNTAPVLADTDPTFDGITEDDRESAGNTVAEIVGGAVTDVNGDVGGIAVTGSTAVGIGWWEYRTTGGDWTELELGPDEVLLLDLDDELRYVPDGRVGGTPQITYRAWDGTSDKEGDDTGDTGDSPGDLLTNIATGGSSAFSLFEETATIAVTELDNDPEITGTVADQNINDNAIVAPFAGVQIQKADAGTELTVTVCLLDNTGALTDANGVLMGNFLETDPGTYEYTGPKSEAEPFLQALIFQPNENIALVGEQTFTRMKITVQDPAGVLPVVDDVTTVNVLSVNDAPEISGTLAGQVISDNVTTEPFADVVIEDADFNEQLALTVSFPDANGALISPDFTKTGVDGQGIATYAYTGAATDKASVQAALRAATFDPQENLLEGRLAYFEFDPSAFFDYRDVSEGFSTEGGMFKLHEEWETFAWRSWDTVPDWIDQDPDPNVEDWIQAQPNVVVDAWKASLTGDPAGDDDEGIAGFTLVIASSQTSAATADVLNAWGQGLTATFVDGASAPEGWQASFYQGQSEEDYTWNIRFATDDPDKFIRPGEAAGMFSFSLTTDDPIVYGQDTVFRFGDPNITAGNPPEYYAAVVFDWFWADGINPGEQGGFEDYFPTGEADPRAGTGFEATMALDTQRVFTTRFDLDLSDLAGAAVNDNVTTVTATPMNDAPVANDDVDDPIGGPLTTDEATAIDIAADILLANDTDVDNTYGPVDTLRVTGAEVIAGVTQGTVSFNPGTGEISYDPAGAFEDLAEGATATDTFTYTITDDSEQEPGPLSDTATVTITITGINDDPSADDDSDTTTEDDAVDISVLDNDADTDINDVLRVSSVGDAGKTSFTTAGGALVTINPDGTIKYDPLGDPAADPAAPGPFDHLQTGEEAQDSFSYTITDDHGGTATANVTITIQGVNDAPYSGPDTGSTDQDTPYHGGAIGDPNAFPQRPGSAENPLAPGEAGWRAKAGYNAKTGELMVSIDGTEPATYQGFGAIGGVVAWKLQSKSGNAMFPGAANAELPTVSPDGNVYAELLEQNGIGESLAVGDYLDLLAGIPGYYQQRFFGWWDKSDPDASNAYQNVSLGEEVAICLDVQGQSLPTGVESLVTGLDLDGNPVIEDVVVVDDLELSYTVAWQIPDATDVMFTTLSAPVLYMNTGLLPNDVDFDGSAAAGPITAVAEIKTSFAGAAVTINADGSYDYEPGVSDRLRALAEGEEFEDTFTYQSQDPDGATNDVTVTITVTGLNDGPVVANDDTAVTDEDNAVDIQVLDNDTDPDMADDLPDADKPTGNVDDDLRVIGVGVAAETHGTVEIKDNGGYVTYTPGPDYHGEASFTYDMSDGNGLVETATVTVTVNPINDAPVAGNDSYTLNEDPTHLAGGQEVAGAVLDVLANDSQNGDESDADDQLVIESVTQPAAGTLEIGVLDGEGNFLAQTPGTILLFTLPAEWSGTVTFDYTLRDRLDPADPEVYPPGVQTATAGVSVTINPVNDPPVLHDKYFSNGVEDSAGIVLNVFAAGVDAQGQAIPADYDVEGDAFWLTPGAAQMRSGGQVFIQDAQAGTVLYVPGPDFCGLDQFKYHVQDSGGATNWARVRVDVAPQPDKPDAVDDTGILVDEETPTVIDVLANDVDPDRLYPDPQPPLNEGMVIIDATDGAHGTVEVGTLNAQGQFVPGDPGDPGTHVRYTPDMDYNGPDSFTYTVDDPVKGLGTDTATVDLTVGAVNDLVQIVGLPPNGLRPLEGDKRPMSPFVGYYQDQDGNDVAYQVGVVETEGHRMTATVTIDNTGNGVFTNLGGFTEVADGEYVMVEKSAFSIENALRAMKFTPTQNLVEPGFTTTTVFTVKLEEKKEDGVLYPVDPPIRTKQVEVDIYSINDPPKIIVDEIPVVTDDDTAVNPFAVANKGGVVELREVDKGSSPTGSQPLDVWMSYASSLQGTLVDPDEATDPFWTVSDDGTTVTWSVMDADADAIEVALARLVFTPDANIDPVGDNTESAFTIEADDGFVDPNFPVKGVVTVQSVSVNDAPVANEDPDYTTDEDSPLGPDASRNLLDNDTDADPGETLTVLSNTAADSGAALTVNVDGTFDYDPTAALNYLAEGEMEPDTFQYTVTDGHGGQSTATVTITVSGVNDDPIAVGDDLTAAVQLQDVTYPIDFGTLIGNDSDPDTSDNPLLTIGSVSATSAKGAAVSIDGDTVVYDPTLAIPLLELAEGIQDTDTFTYTLTDTNGGSCEATVTVTVEGVNDAAIISGTVSGQPTDDLSTIDPFAGVTISDWDGGTLVLTVSYPDENGDLTGAVAGTYAITGTGAEVTAALQGLTFTPAANRALPGSAETTTFTISVEDDLGLVTTNDQTTVVTASNNDPPSIANGATSDTDDKTPVSDVFGAVTISDVDAGNVDGLPAGPRSEQPLRVEVSFPDANGALTHPTLALQYAVDGDVATYTFEATASTATIAMREMVFTPAENRVPVGDVEATTLTITVTDLVAGGGDGLVATDSATLVNSTSINDAPTANPITYVIGEHSVLGSSTADPGLGPASAGTAIAGYNATTGELIVSANGVESWVIGNLNAAVTFLPDPNGVLDTLPTPNSRTDVPPTHDEQTVGDDAGLGGDLTYGGLSLGAIAATGLDINDLFVEYRVGNDPPVQTPLVALEEEPSGGNGVVRNDYDPDPGDLPLTVDTADTQSAVAVADGVAGNVTVAADGTLTYDPTGLPTLIKLAPGEMATDTFTYTVTDGNGEQQTATVTVFIRGENDAPIAVDDDRTDPPLLQTDTADFTFEELITRGDYPDDTSTDWDPDVADNALLTIDSVSPLSANGAAVTIVGETIHYDPTDAAALKALPKDATLDDTFTYNLVDPNGGSDEGTVTLTITGVNDAPTISGVPDALDPVADNVANFKPFAGVSINDVDTGDEVTLTITVVNPDDPDAPAPGRLDVAGTGFTETPIVDDGIITGYDYTVADADAANIHGWVQSLVFNPAQFKESPAGGTSSVKFTFAATDGLGDAMVVVDDQGNPMPAADPEITLTTVWNSEPQVAGVYVRGTEWFTDADNHVHSEYMDLLDTYGYKIPTTELDIDGNVIEGTQENQLGNLPWFNINQIVVQFSEEVDVAAGDLRLFGVNVPEYDLAPGGFQYYKDYTYTMADGTEVTIPDANVGVWTLVENLGEDNVANNDPTVPVTLTDDTLPDKLMLVLDADSISRTSDATVKLDGDWDNPDLWAVPPIVGSAGNSGDGTAGGDFMFRMNVLPGDVDQSEDSKNTVDTGDVGKVALDQFAMMGSGYNVFHNVDGKVEGRSLKFHVTGTDTVLVRNAQGTSLPEDEPAPAPLPALSPASVVLSDGLGGLMTDFGRALREQFSQLDVGLVSGLGGSGADWRAALRQSTVRAVDLALDAWTESSGVARTASDLVQDCWSRHSQYRNDREGVLDDLFGKDDSVVDDELFGGNESPFGGFFRSMAARSNQRANGFMRRMTL